MPSLPSLRRLFLFAVLVPAAVATTTQQLLAISATRHELTSWLYPWFAVSTAVLSWCAGRYLYPAWLRWIIFAWCLALLDMLTITACISHQVNYQFGYILVSAQISLLTLWAVLGPGVWQSRLPSVAVMVPLVVIFSGSFVGSSYTARSWNVMMFVTSPVVVVLCSGLRYLGFVLRNQLLDAAGSNDLNQRPSYQFGVKHMLIWLTVTGPLLLFVRSLDFGGRGIYTAALLAVAVATVNLIAIWAVLGGGHWIIRIGALFGAPYLIAQGMAYYSAYLKTTAPITNTYYSATRNWYGSTAWALADMEYLWTSWLCLDAALLAALLLFLRASGYQLVRPEAKVSMSTLHS